MFQPLYSFLIILPPYLFILFLIAEYPSQDSQSITIGHDISGTFGSSAYNDAVIVPQTLDEGTPFIVVTLSGGTRLAYRLTERTAFAEQTAYQYHIQIKRDGLIVTTSVSDWLPGGIVEGEAGEVL